MNLEDTSLLEDIQNVHNASKRILDAHKLVRKDEIVQQNLSRFIHDDGNRVLFCEADFYRENPVKSDFVLSTENIAFNLANSKFQETIKRFDNYKSESSDNFDDYTGDLFFNLQYEEDIDAIAEVALCWERRAPDSS